MTRIHINLAQGEIEVEGEEAFVLNIYNQFKDRLTLLFGEPINLVPEIVPPKPPAGNAVDPPAVKLKEKATSGKASESGKSKSATYIPKLDKTLDLKNLTAFYGQYAPKNNPDKILIFATFLRDNLSISPCSPDHLFTCFSHMKLKVPEAFLQALWHAHGKKYGYIDFDPDQGVTITIIGGNRLMVLEKKEANE